MLLQIYKYKIIFYKDTKVEMMLEDNSWGDELSILLSTILCNRAIYVFKLGKIATQIKFIDKKNENIPLLLALSNEHFVAILPIKENTKIPEFDNLTTLKTENTL